jgi:hypothetical protein
MRWSIGNSADRMETSHSAPIQYRELVMSRSPVLRRRYGVAASVLFF